jgi:type IX secretion system PorP/SprF family membrane protein
MQINDAWRISGGISLGMFQYTLDKSEITSNPEVYDPVLNKVKESTTKFDATAGLYAWTSYYFVGLSAHQLIGNKFSFYNESDTLDIQGFSRLTRHLYLAGGALFNLNSEFQLSPSALIKYTSPGIVQAEINAKLNYVGMVWFGLSYRTINSISIMAGYNYENKVSMGIAYDYSFSDIQKHGDIGSTIEVLLIYRFVSIK